MHPPLLHCELSITAGLLDPLSGLLDPAAPTKKIGPFVSLLANPLLRVADYARRAFDFGERLSGRGHLRVVTYDPCVTSSAIPKPTDKLRVGKLDPGGLPAVWARARLLICGANC